MSGSFHSIKRLHIAFLAAWFRMAGVGVGVGGSIRHAVCCKRHAIILNNPMQHRRMMIPAQRDSRLRVWFV